MTPVVPRDRLLAVLARRHELTMCALVSPAGFGRSTLLDQASAQLGPGARDLRYDCTDDDAGPGVLVGNLMVVLAGSHAASDPSASVPEVPDSSLPGPVDRLRTALAACDAVRPTALVIDRIERSGTAGTELVRELAGDGSPGIHLVVSGRRLGHVGLARLVVAGRASVLGWRELAFDQSELADLGAPDDPAASPGDEPATWPALAALQAAGTPELVADYLQDEVLSAEEPDVVLALAAVATVGGCANDDLASVTAPVLVGLSSAARDDVIDRVAELPLVGRGNVGCWPHPIWIRATRSVLDDDLRQLVVQGRIAALLARGATGEAGRLAVELASPTALRAVVRAALPQIPATAPVADLRAWQRSDLLGPGVPERQWLDAALQARSDDETAQFERLDAVRRAFEAEDDVVGETGVLLQLGNLARARDDAGALVRLLARAQVLADRGDERAGSLVTLGRAVAAQLDGRPGDAVRIMDTVATGSLPADWAAQAFMIRGTNLLLEGRAGAALAALEAATGVGSDGTMAIAYDLLSTARWQADDPHGALDDAALSVSLAVSAGPPARVQLSQAWWACLLAATGQEREATAVIEQVHGGGPILSGEAAALTAVAEALLRIDDRSAALALLESTAVPDRPVRSSLWRRALIGALSSSEPDAAPELGRGGFGRAHAAGRAGWQVLAGGALADAHHRPYLPARWCATTPASTTVALFGAGTVRRDHRVIEDPAWQRTRVRELCLHLVIVDHAPRAAVAASLWPDRDERSAGQNLRVTLSHLLDVLDPDRQRARPSGLLHEAGGAIRLDAGSGLRVDVWEARRHADLVLGTPEDQRASLLSHARRLLAARTGPLLDGTPVGDWCEPHRRRLDELILGAAGRAGDVALHATDHRLAVDLGTLLLSIDPWSEHGHRLVVEGRLLHGDMDGARRALVEAIGLLDDLGVAPGRALVLLAYRMGLTGRPRPGGGPVVATSPGGRQDVP